MLNNVKNSSGQTNDFHDISTFNSIYEYLNTLPNSSKQINLDNNFDTNIMAGTLIDNSIFSNVEQFHENTSTYF